MNIDAHLHDLTLTKNKNKNKTCIFSRHNDSGVSLGFVAEEGSEGPEIKTNSKNKMCVSGFSKSMPSASLPSSPSSPISTSPTAAAPEITPSIVSLEPASPSAPTSTLQIGPTTLLEGFVPSDEQKRIYRFQGVELIASNNIFAFPDPIIDPRTQYPTERVTDICDNEEFAQCWKENLAPPIVQYLASLVDSWTLNVVRSGFADTEHRPRTPLVVLLSTRLSSTDSCVTEELALDIVRVIAGIISSHWHGERYEFLVTRQNGS